MGYDTSRASVLIIRDGCSSCEEVVSWIGEAISDNKIILYKVFQSRIKDLWEIRAVGAKIEGLPTLLSSDQIKEVPLLYDPILDDMVIGSEDIEEYLEDTGLIE